MPSRIREFVNRLKGLSPRPSSTRSKKSVGSTTTSRSSSPNYDPSVDLATPRAPIVSFPDVVVEAVGLAHMSEDDAAVGIKVVDPEEQETTPARPPVRKAVLVGIQYKKVALLRCREASQSEKCEEDWGELDGTHQDVLTMKGLLTGMCTTNSPHKRTPPSPHTRDDPSPIRGVWLCRRRYRLSS